MWFKILSINFTLEFGLRAHSSNGMNGDHNNGDLDLDGEENGGPPYLEDDLAEDGATAAAKSTTLTDKLSSAKAALLSFRMPTASEIKNNYINSNFHKSLNQPLVVKSRVELPEVQRSRQELTQAKGPAELSQIHGLADLPLPKINLLESSHPAGEEEREAGSIKNGGSLLNLQNFTPMNTLPR
jgi:hypothetical protein